MQKGGLFFIAGLALSAAGLFFSEKPYRQPHEILPSEDKVPPVRRFFLTPASFKDLKGWDKDDMLQALPALRNSCKVLKQKEQWVDFCSDLSKARFKTASDLRKFLESHVRPFSVNGGQTGLFTGYYEPVMAGSLKKTKKFSTPLWGIPEDIVRIDLGKFDPKLKGDVLFGRKDGKEIKPYLTRKEIETGTSPFPAKAVAWVEHPVDAFILQIQGSGRLRLPSGREISIGYAGNNGHKFVGIGAVMAREGLLKKGVYTMSEIKTWLKANPSEAERLMHENPRFIFFKRLKDQGIIGSLGVPLTPKRSLAVDPSYISLGSILWLEAKGPGNEGELNRLMSAQDTGSAIKGAVRGDFFWGSGERALQEAGRMRSQGIYYMLVPKAGIASLKQEGIITDDQAAS